MPKSMKWAIALAIGLGIVALGWKLAANAWFSWVLPTFFVLNCFVLIIVVLLQSGKAADLAGAFGGAGSQTAFGPRGAANVLSRATTWCAIMFMVCALALFLQKDRAASTGSSILQRVSKPAPKPAQTPAPATTPAPAAQQPAAPAGGTQTPATQQPPAKK